MLVVAGLVILVLGIACGAMLLLAALGFIPAAGAAIWTLFPIFTVGGYLAAAAPSKDRSIPLISRISGVALLALALTAAVLLVLHGGSLLQLDGSPWALWYVLAIGLALGGMGLASHQRPPAA
jgi:hypothetical protein